MTTSARPNAREGLVEIDALAHYTVGGVEHMAPFLMSIVSDGDRWMFVSSSGALTAGRRDATEALFPYVTDDRLHAAGGATGPVTVMRVRTGESERVWEPFAAHPDADGRRSVSKTVTSDSVRFDEWHTALGLRFSYRWSSAERYGFVRTATLHNAGAAPVVVDIIDGLVDVVPYGLDPVVYQRLSNLTNAYKRSEVVDDHHGLALFTLEAPVSDRADPEEVLRATAAWSHGLDGEITLDRDAVNSFRRGRDPDPARLVTGVPGAYLRRGRLELPAGSSATWYVVADVGRDHHDIASLRAHLRSTSDVPSALGIATRRTGDRLAEIMEPADAEQRTGDAIACASHMSNVIYNVMRGGVPLDGYHLERDDLVDFIATRQRRVVERHRDWLASLPATVLRRDLLAAAEERGDPHLTRLTREYLPFSFSRRHGDPSRPWNRFEIRVTGDDGRPVRYFEGNWRDVFQNWEALCASFPEYLPDIVSMFVNASTADGHNPYRVTRDGIDWEAPDPDDPWANIGYWGDHQIVYLSRLIEATERYQPGLTAARLHERVYTYADVPYRLAAYPDLVRDPKSTIEYDETAAARTAERVEDRGTDGKLLVDRDGDIVVVSLAEKLLVAALAKLSNFVPGGGIWMNTQRPEWNDANNALVGHGVSMVTLFHLRRFIERLRALMGPTDEASGDDLSLSSDVASWLSAVTECFDVSVVDVDDSRGRRAMIDRLGTAGSDHRWTIYRSGFSGATTPVTAAAVVRLCDLALEHLDGTIATARRPDGLVHSYHLLRMPDGERADIDHLPEMLEGQVAALTPGLFRVDEQADLLDALFASALRRADLDTFMLAPATRPAAFLDKNTVDADDVDRNPLLSALRAAGDTSIVDVDDDGRWRFDADLTSADRLHARLDRLRSDPRWSDLVDGSRADTLAIYEDVFEHHAHLGRSGTMYGYEGIGSVYWHMVTKLLLGVQEAVADAARAGAEDESLARLIAAYWRVRAGLGVNATPDRFGAVPIDPYSHSPAHAGAQQPGMTGAVKEVILTRPRELGVRVEDGAIVFDGLLLRTEELLDAAVTWHVRIAGGRKMSLDLPPGSLGLMLCQVPVVIVRAEGEPSIEVEFTDGHPIVIDGDRLDRATSASVFGRTGEVAAIRAHVSVP